MIAFSCISRSVFFSIVLLKLGNFCQHILMFSLVPTVTQIVSDGSLRVVLIAQLIFQLLDILGNRQLVLLKASNLVGERLSLALASSQMKIAVCINVSVDLSLRSLELIEAVGKLRCLLLQYLDAFVAATSRLVELFLSLSNLRR